ncbi:MAG: hypothetical protein SO122_07645, partial [Eubacteriales bacterium]|nr:hypothetical protein [Eubacteriales bacterium]
LASFSSFVNIKLSCCENNNAICGFVVPVDGNLSSVSITRGFIVTLIVALIVAFYRHFCVIVALCG